MEYVTVKEAAQRLGISERTVQYRLTHGTLKGRRLGRDWLIAVATLRSTEPGKRRPPGRPSGRKRDAAQLSHEEGT